MAMTRKPCERRVPRSFEGWAQYGGTTLLTYYLDCKCYPWQFKSGFCARFLPAMKKAIPQSASLEVQRQSKAASCMILKQKKYWNMLTGEKGSGGTACHELEWPHSHSCSGLATVTAARSAQSIAMDKAYGLWPWSCIVKLPLTRATCTERIWFLAIPFSISHHSTLHVLIWSNSSISAIYVILKACEQFNETLASTSKCHCWLHAMILSFP